MGSRANRRRRAATRRPKPSVDPEAGSAGAAARRFEALGRVMDALSAHAGPMASCRDLTWWRGADDGWHIEWRDGPRADEVADLLTGRIAASAPVAPGSSRMARIEVAGVPFVLRAVDPLDREHAAVRPDLWQLALDTTRRPAARHPWEQLLGG